MFTVFPIALQKVLHTILIVVNCNLIIMLVCTFVGAVACTCARMLTCVCLYVSVFVSVNSWQQIVCVFAVIDARFYPRQIASSGLSTRHAAQFRRLFPMSPAFRAIRGANFFN